MKRPQSSLRRPAVVWQGFCGCHWWIRLGIRVERIVPGHPEQNGAHAPHAQGRDGAAAGADDGAPAEAFRRIPAHLQRRAAP